MELPLRLVDRPSTERLLSVDGAWDQPGLNLSHWPGNATPPELKRDLSTEIALAFDRLPHERRTEFARGCVAIANNHYDSDGLCAAFAVRHPARALAIEKQLIDVARTGDFFELPDERSFQIDLVLGGLVDPERSPWRARFAATSDRERREFVMREAVAMLDDVITGDLERFEELWRSELERLRSDRVVLAAANRDDVTHLDLCVFTARSTDFDPGRHALFGTTNVDRVLAIGAGSVGATYRLVIGTRSWFDLVSRRPLARPSLVTLATRLNELESTSTAGDVGWRHQPTDSPSPELWFGREQPQWFSEHAPFLEQSRLTPAVVRREILEALRAAWTFPEDE